MVNSKNLGAGAAASNPPRVADPADGGGNIYRIIKCVTIVSILDEVDH